MPWRLGNRPLIPGLVHIFQFEEVTFAEFWIEIEVADMPLLGKRLWVLEFYWPDGIIRRGKVEGAVGSVRTNGIIALPWLSLNPRTAYVRPSHRGSRNS